MGSLGRHRNQAENQYVTFQIDSGILVVKFKEDVFLDLSAAVQIVSDRLRFQASRSYPVLCDVTKIHSSTQPARSYLSGPGSENIDRIAFLTLTEFSTSILKWYLRSYVTEVPFEVFSSRLPAVEYLKNKG